MRTILAPLLLLSLSAYPDASAHAEWRCDCTTILAGCAANVAVNDDFIEVTTDHQQCARVDYFIDGLPFVSVVVEGRAREDWITRAENARVLVQSCQVCRDNSQAESTQAAVPAAATQPTQSTPLQPIIAAEPSYPDSARARGIEGTTTLEFQVTPFGNTENVRVIAAQPPGVFDLAAISAVSRWRYPSDSLRETVTLQETLNFDLADLVFDAAVIPTPASRAATDSSGPANRCIRENVSYNYGELIEVGLIDACSQPLIVFACSAGTGATANRWVCTSSEAQNNILVPPNDARVGFSESVELLASQREFTYAEHFFINRAPNSEYWWIACGVRDQACRNEARQWSQAVDRQGVNVNPEVRTRLAVGRSY